MLLVVGRPAENAQVPDISRKNLSEISSFVTERNDFHQEITNVTKRTSAAAIRSTTTASAVASDQIERVFRTWTSREVVMEVDG